MKRIIVTFFLSFIFLHVFANFSDTTIKLAAVTHVRDANRILVSKANVVYPEIFAGHEEASLSYAEKFTNHRRDYLIRTYKRSQKYFPKAKAILKKYNIPSEFAILMALESGFNGNAVSPKGAVGYWQIMDEVAKEYGLRIAENKSKKTQKSSHTKTKPVADDRKNFTRSTIAAARYLQDRARNLNNDWLLIAASYNCGVGNVWNAMKKSGIENPGYWDIQQFLPAETKAYVMNFITLNLVFNNYKTFLEGKLQFKDVYAVPENVLPQGIDLNILNKLL